MARLNILDMLYTKDMDPLEFSFESLTANPLLSYLSSDDIYQLYKIATSVKLSTKPKEKYKRIDAIVKPRGFKKIASGTNRVAYKHLEDTRIVIKIAIDEIGLKDSHREYRNQFLLKPFVTKVFEVSPCGTVGLFERVYPVQTIYEYQTIASDVFDVINTKIIGKYVVDDIGTEFFQNVGVRKGFGIVYLDFPYVYELDGKKLYCNSKINGIPCGGEIDYDAGFNRLICTKCGARYFAHQLKKQEQNKEIILRKGRKQKMKFTIMQGDEVVREIKTQAESNVLPVKKEKAEEETPIRLSVHTGDEPESDAPESKISVEHRPGKMKFSFVRDAEEVGENTPKKDIPSSASAQSVLENKNVSTSDFKGDINPSYQCKDVVMKEETPAEIKKDSDVNIVDSLTITPREGVEYPDLESDSYDEVTAEEYSTGETDNADQNEVPDVETKNLMASY